MWELDRLDIHISAALTACSSVNVWFGILPLSSSCFFNETCPGCGSVCFGTSICVDVDGWCGSFIQVDNFGNVFYWCTFRINYLLDGESHPWSSGSVLDHRLLPAGVGVKVVSSLTSFLYLWRSLGPFTIPCTQMWSSNTNHHHHHLMDGVLHNYLKGWF